MASVSDGSSNGVLVEDGGGVREEEESNPVQPFPQLLPVKGLSCALRALSLPGEQQEEAESEVKDTEKNKVKIVGKDTVDTVDVCKGCLKRRSEHRSLGNDHCGVAAGGRDPPLLEYSLANLHLSPGKKKPLVRKSKLAVLGARYSWEVRSGSGTIMQQVSTCKEHNNKGTVKIETTPVILVHSSPKISCDDSLPRLGKSLAVFQVPKCGVFESVNKVTKAEDFASVSQSLQPGSGRDSFQCSGKKLVFSPHGCRHRGQPKSRRAIYKRRCRLRRPVAEAELPDLKNLSLGEGSSTARSCSQQARSPDYEDVTMDELAAYLDNFLYLPKKMSIMAEMMYT